MTAVGRWLLQVAARTIFRRTTGTALKCGWRQREATDRASLREASKRGPPKPGQNGTTIVLSTTATNVTHWYQRFWPIILLVYEAKDNEANRSRSSSATDG